MKLTTSWAVTTFLLGSFGAYILGKHAEAKGFFENQKVIVLGYFVTSLFLFLAIRADSFFEVQPLVKLAFYMNVFLFPSTMILPALHLMEKYKSVNHIMISAILIAITLLGIRLSYSIFNFLLENDLKVMTIVLLSCSTIRLLLHFSSAWFLPDSKEFIIKRRKQHGEKTLFYLARISTIIIGFICSAGLTHNYFFIEPYAKDILIININAFKFGHLVFYVVIGFFLILSAKFYNAKNGLGLMSLSLIGLIGIALSVKIFEISSISEYIVYKILYAFFFASFLAPGVAFIFSLFKNSQLFFNGTLWFHMGVSSNFLSVYFLSEVFNKSHHYFITITPVVFGSLIFLVVAFFIHRTNFTLWGFSKKTGHRVPFPKNLQ